MSSPSLSRAYKKVDERDHGICQHPGCGSTQRISHHHIEARSQARDRVDCVENIITLCYKNHQGNEGPHESAKWREYWLQWQKKTYPYYMTKAEQNEMERLALRRFVDEKALARYEELVEKWRVWNENKIRV
ncbi:hypothetical protein REC12_11410 [Desulfosporosinus sp. PR]|uniref:hypothetical protein n=1 Tax=Candidatus Desulfosporosinus nitrosoreducens TaxID=3401928 RepID=UPI0027F715D9|nr:hypothetical protein [Desulfosporosinus sp. PR]MDQ7094196.1 hypothetical protein [Desulfosporosinus sp. PR]